MNTCIILGLAAAALGTAATAAPSAATPAQSSTAEQQCRWVAPVRAGGPRSPVLAATWTCTPAAAREKACGRYVLDWPHWLSQRALPPVRKWVAEPCWPREAAERISAPPPAAFLARETSERTHGNGEDFR